MRIDNWSQRLPGGELVRQGLADFQAGQRTIPSCTVGIVQSLFRRAGLLPPTSYTILEPERELYRLLCASGGDAYSRYNSLLRELASFVQALDRETTSGKGES